MSNLDISNVLNLKLFEGVKVFMNPYYNKLMDNEVFMRSIRYLELEEDKIIFYLNPPRGFRVCKFQSLVVYEKEDFSLLNFELEHVIDKPVLTLSYRAVYHKDIRGYDISNFYSAALSDKIEEEKDRYGFSLLEDSIKTLSSILKPYIELFDPKIKEDILEERRLFEIKKLEERLEELRK